MEPEPPSLGALTDRIGWRWLLAIWLSAVLLRVGNAIWLGETPEHFLVEDARMYWREAATFLRDIGDGIYDPHTERTPGYILLVAAIRAVTGDAPLAVAIVQSVLDGLSCVVIALLGAMATPALGRLGGALAAAWPNMIIHSGVILTETLFLLLFCLMLLFCARFLAAARLSDAALAALFCGLALMVRPVAQFLPVALAVTAPAVVWWHGRAGGMRVGRLLMAPALIIGLGLLPAAPWIARNFHLYGSVSLTDQGGVHLLYWVVPMVAAASDGTPHDKGAADARARLAAHLQALGKPGEEELGPFERHRQQSAVALEMLSERPATALLRAWGKGMAINLVAPAIAIDPRVRALPHPSFYQIEEASLFARLRVYLTGENRAFGLVIGGGLAAAAVVSLLQAWGFVRLLLRIPGAALFGGLCIAYFLLVTGPVSSPKYRLPAEPVLILFSAAAVLPRRLLPSRQRTRD